MKYLLMSAAMLLLVTGCKPGNGKNREEVCETDMTRAGQEIKNDSVANIADSIRLYFTYPLPDVSSTFQRNGTKTGPNILRYTPYRHRSFSTVRERKYTGMSDIYLLTN